MTWAGYNFSNRYFLLFSRSKYKETIIIQAYMLCVLDLSSCLAYGFRYVLDESRCTYDIEREGAHEIRLDDQLFESKLEDWKGKVRKMLALAPQIPF